jgi:hypothetical protein
MRAYEESQKYKEGKYVVEKTLLLKEETNRFEYSSDSENESEHGSEHERSEETEREIQRTSRNFNFEQSHDIPNNTFL